MLVTCIECGTQVSDSAHQCPQCKGNPHGVECRRCRNKVPFTKAQYYGKEWQFRKEWSGTHYCYSCVEKLKASFSTRENPESYCPDCKTNLSKLWTFDELLPGFSGKDPDQVANRNCPSCG